MKLPVNYEKLTISEKRKVREHYRMIQKNYCWYCDRSLSENPPLEILDKPINLSLFPDGFLNYPIHLHHNRKTGLTEGAIHAYCNAILWEYYGE